MSLAKQLHHWMSLTKQLHHWMSLTKQLHHCMSLTKQLHHCMSLTKQLHWQHLTPGWLQQNCPSCLGLCTFCFFASGVKSGASMDICLLGSGVFNWPSIAHFLSAKELLVKSRRFLLTKTANIFEKQCELSQQQQIKKTSKNTGPVCSQRFQMCLGLSDFSIQVNDVIFNPQRAALGM